MFIGSHPYFEKVKERMRSTMVAAELMGYSMYIIKANMWFCGNDENFIEIFYDESEHKFIVDSSIECSSIEELEKKIVELL